MDYDLENPLISFQEYQSDTIQSLFASEADHMPNENYVTSFKTRDLDVSFRQEPISLILQFSRNFDPFVPYLAVNYLDRFISIQEVPHGKPWMLRLLGISCFSLAMKMKQTDFKLNDFQRDEGFIFDSQTIQRMELLILGALKWRMRSITPFSFLYFFLSLFELKDPPLIQALKARAIEIIFKAQCEIKLLEFKPSIVAASALLSASHELFPLQFSCFREAISSSIYVSKEKLVDCCNVMHSMVMNSYESVLDMVSSSNTVVNELDLDQNCSSSQSEKKATTTNSLSLGTVRSERYIKRRKINDLFCNEKSFQLSQIPQC